MDTAMFLEKYGYNILLVISLLVVAFFVVVYPAILLWRRFGPYAVLYVAIVAFLVMGVYQVVRKGANLTTTTIGKSSYLNRAKYFEGKEDVTSETISDKMERGDI